MSGTQTGDLKPAAARAGPPWWARVLVYGLIWLPVLVMVLVFAHRFEPIFTKLEEKGELPWLTQWLMAFDRVNAASFYLPALLLALAVLVVDQAVVRSSAERRGAISVRGSGWLPWPWRQYQPYSWSFSGCSCLFSKWIRRCPSGLAEPIKTEWTSKGHKRTM